MQTWFETSEDDIGNNSDGLHDMQKPLIGHGPISNCHVPDCSSVDIRRTPESRTPDHLSCNQLRAETCGENASVGATGYGFSIGDLVITRPGMGSVGDIPV